MSIRDLAPWNWGRKEVPVRRAEGGQGVEPFYELQRDMNRLFESFFDDFGLTGPGAAGFQPRVDVRDTGEALEITAELPGLTEKDVEVELAPGVLTLRGEKKAEKTEERDGVRYCERSFGRFERRIALPEEVDEAGVKAACRDGVLTVTAPKTRSAARRKIEVETK